MGFASSNEVQEIPLHSAKGRFQTKIISRSITVSKIPPETIDELKDAIRAFFAQLSQSLVDNMTANLKLLYEVYPERGGPHLEHAIKCK
ncbi:hypothetical protein Trydic_g3773 [Trypoxylus dichotomus]